ncbi:sulfite oxidase-like oxidoreductase [Cytobacillus sp. NCCP-133]|uniref:sulfite oxidase-like oxidoreductase n=1 Tax=Cytobacillus sp. NCCP-133 TaxID=766848 RepID=UPI002231CD31|nr:sulfite oxidase-like oxidoreductase [Cytobacillus sp. NCCP-133]GLB59674.1 putative oxidoreductase YuiH [Cytobacillus sp. NCCP-133]
MYFGKVRTQVSGRVPPNQNVTTAFPVLHYGNVPYYKDKKEWNLKVFGEVENELTFSYEAVMDLPQSEYKNDIHCVTGWSKLDNVWKGVAAAEFARRAAVKDTAEFVILHAEEEWTTNLPIEDFLRETSLLAHTHNGEVLTPEHGFPLRAVFPHLYFWKSAKWVRGIEFSETDKSGFWEKNGYHNYGNPFKEQRFSWD